MDDRVQRRNELAQLALAIHEGRIDRREFTRRAIALGLASTVIGRMFQTYSAKAAPLAQAAEKTAPIIVTSGGSETTLTEEDIAGAKPGGTMRFGRLQDSSNLDPVTHDGNHNIWVFLNIYDTLTQVGLDGESLVPGLAESWEVSEDGLVYTFHLRDGVRFSDGTPMTSKDVQYSWVRAANDPAEQFTFTLTALARDEDGQVQGIETPDDLTVEVTLAEQWTPFLSDVAMFNMAVISEAFAAGNEERLVDEPMGTGPFALANWSKGEAITLTRNEHYWDEGLPYLDEIIVSVVPDDNARVIQLQTGELDAMGDVPSSRLPELETDPNLKVMTYPSAYIQYITLNTREAPLDDVNARLALQYATDKQTLIDVVLFGKGEVATTFMPKGTIYWNDQLEGFPFDLNKAKELMAASATPEGFAIELQTVAGSEDQNTLAAAIKDMWAQIGVDVTIAPTEASVVDQNYKDHTFEAMVIAWTNDIIDPDEIVYSVVLPENSEAFASGWSNEEAVELGREGPHVPDGPERQEMYYRIQEIFNEDSPLILLFYKPYLVAAKPEVRNFQQPPTGQWVWRKTWLDA